MGVRGESRERGRGDGEARSERKLPCAGGRREVRGGRRCRGDVDRPGQRSDSRSGDHEQQPAPPRVPASEPEQREHEQRRPHEVELLLDRERPEVLDRRGRLSLLEVVAPERGKMHVGGEERGPDAVGDHVSGAHEVEEMLRRDRRHDEREHGGGQDAARAADVEAHERHAPGLERLRQEQARDQEAGEDEEDVDAHVAARQARDSRVPERHEQNGDGAQALDVRPVPHHPNVRRPRSRSVKES